MGVAQLATTMGGAAALQPRFEHMQRQGAWLSQLGSSWQTWIKVVLLAIDNVTVPSPNATVEQCEGQFTNPALSFNGITMKLSPLKCHWNF